MLRLKEPDAKVTNMILEKPDLKVRGVLLLGGVPLLGIIRYVDY